VRPGNARTRQNTPGSDLSGLPGAARVGEPVCDGVPAAGYDDSYRTNDPDAQGALRLVKILLSRSGRATQAARGQGSELIDNGSILPFRRPERPSINILTIREISHSFRGRDLTQAVLSRADLRKADFTGANLNQAELRGANLQSARLSCAFRDGYTIRTNSCTRLIDADLNHAHLQGASLYRARLQGADLHEAELQGADLFRARLEHANLHSAQLQGASLFDATLLDANLECAYLQGANLISAKLEGASLAFVQVWRMSGAFGRNRCYPDKKPWIDKGDAHLSFEKWLHSILKQIPPGEYRDQAEARLSVLDPLQEKPKDEINRELCEVPSDKANACAAD
jgi:uncharacterized protein YjbI with pentapeptide repeats